MRPLEIFNTPKIRGSLLLLYLQKFLSSFRGFEAEYTYSELSRQKIKQGALGTLQMCTTTKSIIKTLF